MLIPAIQNISIPHGTRILLRTTLNLPIEEGKVTSTFRLKHALRTIQFLREKGARITLISHLSDRKASLAPVHALVNKSLPVSFIPQITGEMPYTARKNLQPGEVLLLENTRKDPREEQGDPLFAEELAANSDMFVFDDFSVAHRDHASSSGLVAFLPTYAGIQFYEEMTALLRITDRLQHPAVAVLSGAKCATKIPLALALTKQFDTVFIGGVLANTLLKQKGYSIGRSKAEDGVLSEELLSQTSLILPADVSVTDDFLTQYNVPVTEIPDNTTIVDIGEATLKAIARRFVDAKTIFLNGPTGWYEKGFSSVSIALSNYAKQSRAYTFAGGGDTTAVFEQHNLFGDWQFVSTGGGAAMHYLVHHSFPILEAFEKKKSNSV